ncbi:MAG: DUF1848 domain-containing protein [Nitrospirales bacterium]|nr:DUF1848 domain-containing protein [Nitrospirales bacterium]
MIISASRRTDLPAFYTEWFMNRIREGYALVRNPFSGKESRVDLSPSAVDAIVFWTRNPKPLLPCLAELDARGFAYYFLYTITGYPRSLEPSAPPLLQAIETFTGLSEKIGPGRVIWRFDPILLSTVTSEEYIADTFGMIARQLKGATKRVVISFCEFYKKVSANLEALAPITCFDISRDEPRIRRIASSLAGIARTCPMEISSCADARDLSPLGIRPGKCVDDALIQELFGVTASPAKDKGQRKECGCVQSRDIGEYSTCLHGCVYCYATANREEARRKALRHNPESPFLIG